LTPGGYQVLFARLLESLSRVPEARDWAEVVAAYVGFCALALVVSPDLISIEHGISLGELILIATVALLIPAFSEEVVFRGLLLPRFDFSWVPISLSAYVLWHPIESFLVFPQAAPLFTDFAFLFLVGVLGLLCTLLYHRSESLWTSIVLHWMVVVSWKAAGGARFVL
jgi:predicted Abi (CAAX) family protease